MKYYYALLLLLLGNCPLWAQSAYTIQFHVSDAQTSESLPMAAIWLKNIDKGLVTDSLGDASFNHSGLLEDSMQVHFLGYNTFKTALHLTKDTLIQIKMVVDDKLLEEVQVIGHEHYVSMKTLSVGRLSAQKLELSQGGGLGQSLEQISGVSTLKTGNNISKPMIHGLHSNRILILNNGIKQEGQQWGAEHAPEIDVFTAEQLSVVKGAATVKYGSEALGGVVLVSPPKLPTSKSFGGSVHVLGASNGRMGAANASLEGGAESGLGWRIQASAKQGGDMRAPDYWLTNTGVKEFGGSAAMGWNKEQWGIEGYYSYYQNTTGLLKATSVLGSLEDLALALSGDTPALTEEDFSYDVILPRQEVRHHLLKLNGYFKLGKGKLEWVYGGQIDQRQEYDRRLGAALSTRPVIDLALQSHSLDLSYNDWKLGKWNSTVGLNLAYKDNNNKPGTGRIPLIPNYNGIEAGLFLVEQATFDRWEVEFGLRFDTKYYSVRGRDFRNDLFEEEVWLQNFTATAGVSYQLSKNATLHTNIGTAWRAPHVAELYSFGKKQGAAAIEYGLLIDEQNEVEAWDSKNTPNEQGLKWVATYERTKSDWQLSVTGYLNWIQNYIYLKPQGVTVGVAGPYPFYRHDQTDALFSGLDMTSKYQLSQKWLWEASSSLIWAQDLGNNDELPFIPANRIGTSIQYKIPAWKGLKDLYFKAGYDYTFAPTQAPSRVISVEQFVEALSRDQDLVAADPSNFDFMPLPDAYGLLHLAMGAAWARDNGHLLRVGLKADNLLNVRYRNYMNRLRYFSDEAGRNVTVSIKYIF